MTTNRRLPLSGSDLQGAARLAVQGVKAITDIVENMHRNIARVSPPLGVVPPGHTRGITGLVYRSIRDITGLVGSTLDVALEQLQPLLAKVANEDGHPARDALVAVLNGVLGDHLAETQNPLAIPMQLRRDGRALPVDAGGGRVLLLIHGLCMDDLQWRRREHDHGSALSQALGYQPVYLRYNSGLHISVNGRQLAQRLEDWFQAAADPITELAILGYSMGGLLAAQRLSLRGPGRTSLAAGAQADRFPRHAALRRADGARRQLVAADRQPQPVHRTAGRPGPAAQRRHHRPAPRQLAG